MQRPTTPVTVAGPDARVGRRLAWVLIAGVLVSIVKPWGGLAPAPIAADSRVADTDDVAAPASVPEPTARPTSELDVVASFCREPSGWRVYSAEVWADQRVRWWTTVTPVKAATGPTDPRIPIVRVSSRAVLAIGFCSPVGGPERPPVSATDELYRLTTASIDGRLLTTAAAMTPRRVEPADRASHLGAAYGPVSGARWPDGVYVLHIQAAGFTRWFGIEVETLDLTASR